MAGTYTSLEICAGAGGQALGLEEAGFHHVGLVEIDQDACDTLCLNRPRWKVLHEDLRGFSGSGYSGVDLIAGGVPCPPFSVAGRQLGSGDERDMFPDALRLVAECRPRAVMIENVRGLLGATFDDYRRQIDARMDELGYVPRWRLLHAADYGVSQLRPRVVLVGLPHAVAAHFTWPKSLSGSLPTVGDLLFDLMNERRWRGARAWRRLAADIAPTLVGGSKKHGGPDLGPTRAKQAWARLGVDGTGIADSAPDRDFEGMPKLTTRMAARLQGFPDSWKFSGRKTTAYRQIGNAFPPPVAKAVGRSIIAALRAANRNFLT